MRSISVMRSLLSSRLKPSPPPHIFGPASASASAKPSSLKLPAASCCPTNPLRPVGRSFCRASADGPDRLMEPHAASGEIHVIVGPMFAGKTTALLRRVQSEVDRGRDVAVIKSNKDTRYGLDSIVTHDGARMPCWALSELSTFEDKLGTEAYEKLDLIGIDEAQFFEDLYDFCCKVADRDGKIIIVAGLDGDYMRKRFGSVLDIIPLADSVTKLTARCELCGRRAFFTLRKTKETQTELIGGADIYMPVCRQHYVDGQIVIEATRIVLDIERSAMIHTSK